MEKRIALIKDAVVFNIVVGNSVEEMETLFDCEAKEVSPESGPAHIGYGFSNGIFEQPPIVEPEVSEESAIIE
jgi:hypothetical protein